MLIISVVFLVYTLMPAPRNGVSQTLSRQAKRVELPVVPHMEMISNKHGKPRFKLFYANKN